MFFETKRVCTEWDGMWFCEGCGSMKHWKTKGHYKDSHKGPYCKECREKLERGEKIRSPYHGRH